MGFFFTIKQKQVTGRFLTINIVTTEGRLPNIANDLYKVWDITQQTQRFKLNI